MSFVVNNRIDSFGRSAKGVLNDALRESAVNILVSSKNFAPFKMGGLRSDSNTRQEALLHWRISYFKEYARFQEYGGDNKRTVRRYSTSGTGKKFLSRAGNNEVRNLKSRLSAFAKRARA